MVSWEGDFRDMHMEGFYVIVVRFIRVKTKAGLRREEARSQQWE